MPPRPGEDDLIARYFAPLAGPAGLGLKDDAALLRRRRAAISCSPPTRWSPACISSPTIRPARSRARRCGSISPISPPRAPRRSASCSISRCRATGRPIGSQPSPPGSARTRRAYDCPLLGGDTVKTPGPLTLSITALRRGGDRPHGRAHRRARRRSALRHRHDRRRRARPAAAAGAGAGACRRASRLPARPLSAAATAPRAGAGDGALRQRRHGRLRRLRRRSHQDAARQRRQRADRTRPPAAVACGDCGDRRRPALFEIAATGGDDYELLAAVAARAPARRSKPRRPAPASRRPGSARRSPARRRRALSVATGAMSPSRSGSFSHF